MSDDEIRIERARAILDEPSDFNPNEKNRILRGMTILSKYSDVDREFASEHDQIYCGDFESTAAKMTDDEIREMSRCNWFESEDSWSHHV
jgi:hypothetical protein